MYIRLWSVPFRSPTRVVLNSWIRFKFSGLRALSLRCKHFRDWSASKGPAISKRHFVVNRSFSNRLLWSKFTPVARTLNIHRGDFADFEVFTGQLSVVKRSGLRTFQITTGANYNQPARRVYCDVPLRLKWIEGYIMKKNQHSLISSNTFLLNRKTYVSFHKGIAS